MANKQETATEIVDKLINIFKHLPFFLKPGTLKWGATALKLDNGSRIVSSATTESTSIGFTVDILYLDEFAHIGTNIVDNFWRSVYPTLSSLKSSQCIITSTPNGVGNKFYELWDGATKKKNTFTPIKVYWW